MDVASTADVVAVAADLGVLGRSDVTTGEAAAIGMWLVGGGLLLSFLAWWKGRSAIEGAAASSGVVGRAAGWISETILDSVRAFDVDGQYLGLRPVSENVREPAIWTAVRGPLSIARGERSSSGYAAVIDQLDVGRNPRYAVRDTNDDGKPDYFCNIFVADVLLAMGYSIPWDTATRIATWFSGSDAASLGWRQVQAWDAQTRANGGYPTVAVWANVGAVGHMAIVRPGIIDARLGPTIAQAGARVLSVGHVADGFGLERLALVSYFTAP